MNNMKYVVVGLWFSIPVPSRYSIGLLLLLSVTAMFPLSFFSSMSGLVEYQCWAMTHGMCDCQDSFFF